MSFLLTPPSSLLTFYSIRMTYDGALAFWYGRIDYERKAAKPGDLKLDRMRALLRLLGDPHRRYRIVHVAGTKGKGSTAAILAAVLRAAEHRVGLFTSPHLSDVSERIQVDGVPINRDELVARMREVEPAVRRLERRGPDHSPTFFEVGTALGFTHFDCRRVDVAVVEVGLGGRFDSTNVCMPTVSVITNISFDHMAQLGDSLERITREKGGIIKRGRPVVTTATAPEALAVIDQIARERRAPLMALGRDFGYEYEPGQLLNESAVGSRQSAIERVTPNCRLARLRVTTRERAWPWLELALFGGHQAENAAGVVAVVEQLQHLGLPIADAAVACGLRDVRWPARLEVMGERPLILLDCAHNVASAQALVDTLRDSFRVAGRRALIFAVSNDKQVPEMLRVLAPHFDRFFLTRYAGNVRSVPPEQLAALLDRVAPGAALRLHASAADAWRKARDEARADDLIAITGSVFLAGELRTLIVPG
jgi:dihydrofolate synthase / folylpolyglutamate synthase